MSIVLNEYDWAEKMIANHDLGKKPIETLSRVSKYYYENHYSKREIRSLLDSFMLQCDPSASLVHWSDMLDKVAKNVSKFPLIRLDGVDITSVHASLRCEILGRRFRPEQWLGEYFGQRDYADGEHQYLH